MPPTKPPFAVPNQLVGSGHTFTSKSANWVSGSDGRLARLSFAGMIAAL